MEFGTTTSDDNFLIEKPEGKKRKKKEGWEGLPPELTLGEGPMDDVSVNKTSQPGPPPVPPRPVTAAPAASTALHRHTSLHSPPRAPPAAVAAALPAAEDEASHQLLKFQRWVEENMDHPDHQYFFKSELGK